MPGSIGLEHNDVFAGIAVNTAAGCQEKAEQK